MSNTIFQRKTKNVQRVSPPLLPLVTDLVEDRNTLSPCVFRLLTACSSVRQSVTNLDLICTHSLLLKQAVYTASLTVGLLKFFLSNRCLTTLRTSAVADIKAGISACFDMKEGSCTLF